MNSYDLNGVNSTSHPSNLPVIKPAEGRPTALPRLTPDVAPVGRQIRPMAVSYSYEAGAEYKFDDHWTFRGGYIFSQNSVPSSTYSPSLPDSNRHVFSTGVGFGTKKFTIDLTYQYSLSTDRTVKTAADPAVNGKWTSSANALMASTTFKF